MFISFILQKVLIIFAYFLHIDIDIDIHNDFGYRWHFVLQKFYTFLFYMIYKH